MNVQVKLFATFRKGRFNTSDVELADGVCVGEVLDQLTIPRDQVGILLVNGRDARPDDALAADDVVSIFPSIGGG